jgi:hypothetical protein
MRQIYVAMDFAGKTLPVGVIRFDLKQNWGSFTYLPTYAGPPLDPVNLDYRKPVDPKDRMRKSERVFFVDPTANPGLMHQVFVDAMPGQWGMAVLQAEYPEIRQMKDVERLHWMGARTAGALSFFVQSRAKENVVHGLDQLEVVRAKCAEFLAKLQKMGLEGIRNPAVASHGGVMPKAAYEDGSGRHWIAKFDRPGEGTQYSVLEHLTCRMAERCGINTPETKAIADGMGGHMFLTERFDRSASDRSHKASFLTLTKAREAGSGDYRDLFRVLKEVSDPAMWPAQRDELLRRMAFNVGMNVTDDHLRNHETRLLPSGTWELSPAFDLVPVSGPSPHQCALFGKPRADINLANPKTREFWMGVAAELGATPEHVLGVVGKVAETIQRDWPELVKSGDLNRFNQMNALMATEVGCGVPFPEVPKSTTRIPLSASTVEELAVAAEVVKRAVSTLRSGDMSKLDGFLVSKSLAQLNTQASGLASKLEASGQSAAAELLMHAPLMAAAKAVLESNGADGHEWRDLADAGSSLEAVVAEVSKGRAVRRPGRS